jgi:hypothetical protein
MRARVPLLEHLVKMWDPNDQVFKVGSHDLSLDIEDIYFLTGLSRGEKKGISIRLSRMGCED